MRFVIKYCRSCGKKIEVPAHFDNICFKCDRILAGRGGWTMQQRESLKK